MLSSGHATQDAPEERKAEAVNDDCHDDHRRRNGRMRAHMEHCKEPVARAKEVVNHSW